MIKQNVGVFDAMPLSLISSQSIARAGRLVDADLPVGRFRPNFLVDATTGEDFPEDAWVGAVLRIGGLRMRVDQRDERCVMVNIDPESSDRNPAVLRALARQRQACLGVYGSIVAPGRVAVGDPVLLESAGLGA